MNIRISSTTGVTPVLYLPEDMYNEFNTDSTAKLTIDGMKLTVDCGKTLEDRVRLAVKTKRELIKLYGHNFCFMSNRSARVVACAVNESQTFGMMNGKTHVGVAVCAPDDVWSEAIGEAIAMCRAIEIPVPKALVSF